MDKDEIIISLILMWAVAAIFIVVKYADQIDGVESPVIKQERWDK